MQNLFMVFLLLSVVLLPVSLIKPSVFSNLLKRKFTRINAGLLSLGMIVIFFVLVAITGDGSTTSTDISENDKTNTDVETSSVSNVEKTDAIEAVKAIIPEDNLLNLDVSKLEAVDNPKGEGIFVYYPETVFYEVERYVFWLVVNEAIYVLNGTTKDITPEVLWAREADDAVWSTTGLDKYSAIDDIAVIFKD